MGDSYTSRPAMRSRTAAMSTGISIHAAGGKTVGVLQSRCIRTWAARHAPTLVMMIATTWRLRVSAIDALDAQDVDLIIGLTHLYMQDDNLLGDPARRAPETRVHRWRSRSRDDQPYADRGSAAIFKGSSNARVVWRIDVDFDAAGDASIQATALPMDLGVAKDVDYQALEDRWRAELLRLYPIIDAKVGTAAVGVRCHGRVDSK